MKNFKICLYVLLIILFSSCTKDEKQFLNILKKIIENKSKLVSDDGFPILDTKKLLLLKDYSDLILNGDDSFQRLMKKRSSRKRMKKQLLKSDRLSRLCSSMFLSKDQLNALITNCKEGPFDICPASFSKYSTNLNRSIGNLKKLIGSDSFLKTDCSKIQKRKLLL